MLSRLSKFITATGAAAAITVGAIPRPASADTTSTLLTAAAAIGAIILYNNYQHKRAEANTIVGYTRNGGVVYGDGRIVMPYGQTYYPNANGQYAINQYGYNNGYNPYAYGYAPYTNPPPYYAHRRAYTTGYDNNGYAANRAAWEARRRQERALEERRWRQREAAERRWHERELAGPREEHRGAWHDEDHNRTPRHDHDRDDHPGAHHHH